MTLPIEFSFEGAGVRVIVIDGEPWWLAVDICRVLGLSNPTVSVSALDDDERAKFNLGRQGETNIINESGLYTLVLRCRDGVVAGTRPHRFRKWITSEVLPSIRKHGAYVMPAAEPVPEEAATAPMAPNVEADEIVSAGRVFRAMFNTARAMGMARRLAATRANQAAQRATGVDLAAELSATTWLAGADLPAPQRRQYELQQRIREHLVANDWPQGFTTQHLIEALALPLDKATQMAIGQCLQLLGYTRVRLAAQHSGGPRQWGYVLKQHGLQLELAA